MHGVIFITFLFFMLYYAGFHDCVKIIPEKAVTISINKKYLANASSYVTQLGRKGPKFLNIEGVNKQTWDNNVTVNLVVYEYMGKEYKRTFVEFHFRLCEMLSLDPNFGAMVARAGIVCPVRPGMHRMVNMTIPDGELKYIVFFKKCMVSLELAVTATGESMAKANFYFSIIHK